MRHLYIQQLAWLYYRRDCPSLFIGGGEAPRYFQSEDTSEGPFLEANLEIELVSQSKRRF